MNTYGDLYISADITYDFKIENSNINLLNGHKLFNIIRNKVELYKGKGKHDVKALDRFPTSISVVWDRLVYDYTYRMNIINKAYFNAVIGSVADKLDLESLSNEH